MVNKDEYISHHIFLHTHENLDVLWCRCDFGLRKVKGQGHRANNRCIVLVFGGGSAKTAGRENDGRKEQIAR